MGGVVVGSTMEKIYAGQKWLAVIINTRCNISCPMCYLGEKSPDQIMSLEIARWLSNYAVRNCDGIAVIGTEPLLNEESVEIIQVFAERIRTHIMTNGVNLEKFAERISGISRVDVSLDGGPKTYSRSESFATIQRGAHKWKNMNGGKVYVINTLSLENISNIDDMLEGSRLLGAEQTFFSPYVRTLGGYTGATPLRTTEIVKALLPFSGERWKLLLDPYHAIFESREWSLIKKDTEILPEENRLIIDFDPAERVRRVDANGCEHHPFIALHPGIRLPGKKIY